MESFQRTRRAYPSDVTDAQWRRISPLFPQEKPRGRHREIDLREVVNAIHYRWTTGCVWRMLPHDFPPWGTVYSYFRDWQRDGTLTQLRDQLLKPRFLANNNEPAQPSRCCDPAHESSAGPHWPCHRPDRRSASRNGSERAA